MEPASFSDFLSAYEAWFGPFPVDEKDMGGILVWRRFVEKVPRDLMDQLFESVVAAKERPGKPRIEWFYTALQALQRGRQTRQQVKTDDYQEQKRRQKIPFFDFSKPGYPLLRRLELVDIPRRNRRWWWKLTRRNIFHRDLFPTQEYLALVEETRVFEPAWEDYTKAEQQELIERWGLQDRGIVINGREVDDEEGEDDLGETWDPTTFDVREMEREEKTDILF